MSLTSPLIDQAMARMDYLVIPCVLQLEAAFATAVHHAATGLTVPANPPKMARPRFLPNLAGNPS